MALVVADRVRETTTTEGTGTITLGGAVANFETFTANLSDSDTTYYAIVDSSNNAFEVGLGTFTASGTTLARTTIIASSNSNNAVNFGAGTKDVFITVPADKMIVKDASGNISVSADTDASAEIGRAHIGNIGFSDIAGFSHVDQDNANTYAIAQNSSGTTFLNAADGTVINFNINNSDIINVNSTSLFLFSGKNIVFEGSTVDDHETFINVIDPTADRAINFPDASGTISLTSATETLTNKTLTTPVINGFSGTGDGSIIGDLTAKTSDGAILKLQTSEPTVVGNDVLGAIEFSAPDENDDQDARLTAASISAQATSTFTTTNNSTNLIFKTGSSEAAQTSLILANDGFLRVYSNNRGSNVGAIQLNSGTTSSSQGNVIFTNSDGQLCFGMDNQLSQIVFKLDDEDGQPIFTFSEEDGTAILDGGDTDVTVHKPLIANSTYTGGGLMTTGGNIVIPNAGNIGSASDTDAIAIASDGKVTFSQELIAPSLDISGNVDVDGTLEADAITVDGTALGTVIAGTTVTNATNATLASTVTVSDSTANTNFPVVFHDESNGLLDDTGALRYNPSTGELLVPKLTVAGTTTTVDTVTMNAQNAVVFEGATADANETTLTITDPTADRTITLPDTTGTVSLVGATETLTNKTLTTPVIAEIDNSGDITLDAGGDIVLDAGGEQVIFKDGSTNVGHIDLDSDNLTIKSLVQDKDIVFKGNDGGSEITALTLDMGGGGTANFLHGVKSGQYFWMTNDGNTALFAGANFEIRLNHIHDTGFRLNNSGTGTPAVELQFVDENESIGSDGTNLVLKSGGNTLTVPNASGTIPVLAAASTTSITSTPEELNILDGVTATAAELNIMDGVTSTTAELNILDGVTATTAELNLMDGGTSAGTTAVAGGDGIVTNDNGTMRQTTVDTFDTYLSATTKTLTNKTLTTPVINGFSGTGDGSLIGDLTAKTSDGALLKLQTSATSVGVNDVLGAIEFSAPDEDSGGVADNLAAAIEAKGTLGFTNTLNSTDLIFKLGASETATEKMRFTHDDTLEFANAGSSIGLRSDNDMIIFNANDVTIKHNDLIVQDIAFTGGVVQINTTHPSLTDGQVIGRIDFTATADSAGGDANALAASIVAEADANFTATNNETDLVFKLGVSEAATEKMRLHHEGNLSLMTDAAVLGFGADTDVTLTHVADTGLLLNSTSQLQFNDASQYINAPSATVLDINATDEIELNATLVDVNANLDVSGTYTGGGLMTTGGNIVIPDAGTIGSASDTDAIAIASDGKTSFSQDIIMANGVITSSGQNLNLQAVNNKHTQIKDPSGDVVFRADRDGFAELRESGNTKLATTSTGISITGDVTTSGNIELGNASDTTLARSSAGVVTIEGNTIATREQLKGDATNGAGVFSDELIARKLHTGTILTAQDDSTQGIIAGRPNGGFFSHSDLTADRIHFMPVMIPGTGASGNFTVGSFMFRTGFNGTINNNTVKMGLYTLNTQGYPSQLVSKSSASSGTSLNTQVTATPDVTSITPGRYALALVSVTGSTRIVVNFNSTGAGGSFFQEGFSDFLVSQKPTGLSLDGAMSSGELPTDLSSTSGYIDQQTIPFMMINYGSTYTGE